MQKILSIVLPTFNQAAYLDENLGVLLPQLLKNSQHCELLICDNCSIDNTPFVIEKYNLRYNNLIHYVRRNENIGSYRNFEDGVSRSSGKFVFLLGDDDLLSPNFLDIIVQILLDNPECGLVNFNRIVASDNFNINNTLYNTRLDGFPISITSLLDYLKLHLKEGNFMSSIVFSKIGRAHV